MIELVDMGGQIWESDKEQDIKVRKNKDGT